MRHSSKLQHKIKVNDIYTDLHVHIEENYYCIADSRVLNEGKLVGWRTVVSRLMKYGLGGRKYMGTIADFFIQYMTGCVCTKCGVLKIRKKHSIRFTIIAELLVD